MISFNKHDYEGLTSVDAFRKLLPHLEELVKEHNHLLRKTETIENSLNDLEKCMGVIKETLDIINKSLLVLGDIHARKIRK